MAPNDSLPAGRSPASASTRERSAGAWRPLHLVSGQGMAQRPLLQGLLLLFGKDNVVQRVCSSPDYRGEQRGYRKNHSMNI